MCDLIHFTLLDDGKQLPRLPASVDYSLHPWFISGKNVHLFPHVQSWWDAPNNNNKITHITFVLPGWKRLHWNILFAFCHPLIKSNKKAPYMTYFNNLFNNVMDMFWGGVLLHLMFGKCRNQSFFYMRMVSAQIHTIHLSFYLYIFLLL